jgi:AcrR family transcriptional regulator
MPKIVDHDLYRKELLSKCFDLFAEKGYAAVTMRQIAQGIGVSTGTLYHYFPSKEALFEQLVEYLNKEDLLKFEPEMADVRAKPLEERLKAAVQLLAKHEDHFFHQVMILIEFYQQHGPKMRESEVLQRIDQEETQVMIDFLGIDDPALLAFLDCWFYGFILRRVYERVPVSPAQQAQLLTQLVSTYLQQTDLPQAE